MAVQVEIYAHTAKIIAEGSLNWDNMRVILVNNGYVFDASHATIADVNPYELSTGGGYTSNGILLVSEGPTGDAGGFAVDCNDVMWASLTATFRRAVIYQDVTHSGYTRPPLFSYLLDDTPNDIIITDTDYSLIVDPGGLIKGVWA